jgi:signal transduction histidine kinase
MPSLPITPEIPARPSTAKQGALFLVEGSSPVIEVEGPEKRICSANAAFHRLSGLSSEDVLGRPLAELSFTASGLVPIGETQPEPGGTGAAELLTPPVSHTLMNWWVGEPGRLPSPVIVQYNRSVSINQNLQAINSALIVYSLQERQRREDGESANLLLGAEILQRKVVEQSLRGVKAKLRRNAEELEQTIAERTAQLRASVAEMEAFSYTLAHDLRAPLRGIQSFTELVLEMPDANISLEASRFLKRVVLASARMDSLIQDVLTLTQVSRREIRVGPLDVDSLVRALIGERPEFLPPLAGIRIEGTLLPMQGHEASLALCVTNLLSNAVKFVARGVRPEIRIWSEPGPLVRLWIEDQGIGIPSEAQEKIFEMFIRLHGVEDYPGSGIGLSVVRRAMDRMGGRAGIESAPGPGSRFWLELPGCP